MCRHICVLALLFVSLSVGQCRAQNGASFLVMDVKVVDTAGKPLEEAIVGVETGEFEFPLTVDDEGITTLNLPGDAESVTLTARCAGHVPLQIHWQQNVPTSFTFTMSEGEPIGGIVHDERGKPIAGVLVEGLMVASPPSGAGEAAPIVSGELARTDAEGRWQANVGTAEPLELRLKLSHEEYFSDPSFGRRRVSNEALRSLSHVEVLADRIPPQGIVRDVAGRPVENAEFYVVAGYDKFMLENGRVADKSIKPAARSDGSGTFEFEEQEREFTIICLADAGWAVEPSRRFAKNEPVNIKLTPWSGVRGVLTEEGKPVQGEKLLLEFHLDSLSADNGQVRWRNHATTNEKGEFTFERLINGFASLGAELEYCGDSDRSRQDFSIEAQTPLTAGENAQVAVDRRGLAVKGTVIPLRYDNSEAAIVCGMIELVKEQEAADMVKNLFFEWGQAASMGIEFDPIDNAVRNAELLKNPPRPKYLGSVDTEGRFRFEHLPPGKYRATVHIRAEATDESDEAWLTGHIWDAFPVAAADGKENSIDLGLLEFEVYESEE